MRPGPAAARRVTALALSAVLLLGGPTQGVDGRGGDPVDLGTFDAHAEVCVVNPGGWSEEERLALVEEGRALFTDTRAFGQQPSQGPTVQGQILNCAACHANPGRTDGRVHLVGPTEHRPLVARQTPHLLDIGDAAPYGWDGRFPCLQAAIRNAVVSPLEMRASRPPEQRQLDALAEFVKTLDAPEPRPGIDFDPQLAARGARLFEDYRGVDVNGDFEPFDGVACIHCHVAPRGTDRAFHPILLPPPLLDVPTLDPGHIDSHGKVRGFKTPVLRGVRLTAPYFHDGSMGAPGEAGPSQERTIAALLEMMAAYRARFAFDFTPEEELAIVHYLLSL